jgi:NADPH-dependent ferric siderophore reductase
VPAPADLPSIAQTHLLTVTDVRQLTPLVRRVTLTGDSLAGFAPWPGQDVVLHLTDADGNGVRRRYTVRNFDAARRRFDIDVVVHGHGPGSAWAADVRPGDRLEIFGPRGKVPVSAARRQLFVGDESAWPAIAEIAAALPASASIVVLAEVADAREEQPLETRASCELRWLHRDGRPAGDPQLLSAALDGFVVPDADRHVYVFGESRVVRLLRDRLLREHGLAFEEVSAKGYWNIGRAMRD